MSYLASSPMAIHQCMHLVGHHNETRVHVQRCVKEKGAEVVVAEEFGEPGNRTFKVTNQALYDRKCSDAKEASACGHPSVRV